MTNKTLIERWVLGTEYGEHGNMLALRNSFVSYRTTVALINRAGKQAAVSMTKYSATTSKHCTMLADELKAQGFIVVRVPM